MTPSSVIIINEFTPNTTQVGGAAYATLPTPMSTVTVEPPGSRKMSKMPRINESSGKELSAAASKADVDEDEA